MAFDFPNSPTVNQKFNPGPGLPTYMWDGSEWTVTNFVSTTKTPVYSDGSVPMTAALTLSGAPVAGTDAADKAYVDGRTVPTNQALPASCNFNTITAEGTYYTNDPSSTNTPYTQGIASPGDNFFFLQARQFGANNYTDQIASGVNFNTRFTRKNIGGTWTPWALIPVASVSTMVGGFAVSPYNIGTASGTVTPSPYNGNYQYITNNGAFTLAAPSVDCAIDILVINGASAGAITFSGFRALTSVGDPLTTTNGQMFLCSIRRINTNAFYLIKALQ